MKLSHLGTCTSNTMTKIHTDITIMQHYLLIQLYICVYIYIYTHLEAVTAAFNLAVNALDADTARVSRWPITFWKSTHLFSLMANFRLLSAIPAVISTMEGKSSKVAQRRVYKALESLESPGLFHAEVLRRTARWRPRGMRAEWLTARMRRLLGLVRPRVAMATYWLWFNAWPVRSRFGGGCKACLFCGEGRDEVGHYTRCRVVLRAHALAFGIAPPWRWSTFFSANAEVCDVLLAAQATVLQLSPQSVG
jgi:hypothetical protein